MMQRRTSRLGVVAAAVAVSASVVRAAEPDVAECPVQARGVLVVSPMAGWNRNEIKMPARGPMPATTMTDTEPEYGLFAMYAHPRLVVNNMFFYTEPNGADVSGNMTFANVYGAPDSAWRWNVGAGYLWHEIETEGPTIKVTAPMVKAGAVFRAAPLRMSFNPYLGYVWEDVETAGNSEHTGAVLYGLTVNWQWRMLHATCKYYLQDGRDREEQFNVLRARIGVRERKLRDHGAGRVHGALDE